jgi:hypothetical protein
VSGRVDLTGTDRSLWLLNELHSYKKLKICAFKTQDEETEVIANQDED